MSTQTPPLLWWQRQVRDLRRRGLSDHLAHEVFVAGDETLLREMQALDDDQLANLSRVDLALRAGSGERCSICTEPAAYRREVKLSSSWGDDDWVGHLLAGDPPAHTPATLQVWTCEQHDTPVCDVLLMRFDGSVGGEALFDRPHCDDPFHTRSSDVDDDGEYEVEIPASKGMRAFGYRCPTCGFQTATRTVIGSHPEVEATIISWLEDRRENP